MKLTTRIVALAVLLALVAFGSLTSMRPQTADAQIPNADLSVTKAGPATVAPGGTITYTITITANGPQQSEMINFNDVLDGNVTFVSWTQTSGPTFVLSTLPGAVFAQRTPFMLVGESAVFSLVVTANAGLPGGTTIVNTCSVTTTSTAFPDQNPTNNTCVFTTTVQIPTVDLAVTKTDSPDPVQPNNLITYTVTLSNPGTVTADNVVLTDAVPANTLFFSAVQTSGAPAFTPATPAVGGTGAITFSAATMPGGSTVVFTIMVRVNTGVANGTTITNTATVATTTTETNLANNTATATTLVTVAPTPVPATVTPVSPTVTPIPVPVIPVIPQVFQQPVGGIFNGSRNNTPTPVVRAVVAPAIDPGIVIVPPRTGDAGLEGTSNNAVYGLAVIAALTVLSLGVARLRSVRAK
jgi:uncharacterized repeat protein (TIGR01451 family)